MPCFQIMEIFHDLNLSHLLEERLHISGLVCYFAASFRKAHLSEQGEGLSLDSPAYGLLIYNVHPHQ